MKIVSDIREFENRASAPGPPQLAPILGSATGAPANDINTDMVARPVSRVQGFV
jgi:hypothetical protein